MPKTPAKMPDSPSVPGTPDWMAPLSRELESVFAQKNLLTGRSRKKVRDALHATAAESEEAEVDRLRSKAIEELLQSERSYLRHLEIVQEFFMEPLRERDLIPQQDYVALFGDLPSIIQVNKELLSNLENSDDKIGKVFLELAPYLKFYSTYAQDFQSSAKLVEKWMEKHKGFKTFLEAQETRPEVQLKLNALLITPVQRIPRYKMLLEDVIRNTPDLHPDKVNLTEALKQIEDVAWHINDQLREHENGLKMLDIQRSLVGQFPKIVIPGRKLVKHGNLMKVPRSGGSGQPRYFVLFSDMIMYCKIKISGVVGKLLLPKANALECGCMMPLKHTKIETLVGKGVFKIICKKEELILYSQELGESEEWVEIVGKTIEQHKKDSSTLRKDSSCRDPLKRPEILKMRRESLSQIMLNNSKQKMNLRDRQSKFSPKRLPFSSPKKKKNTTGTPITPVVFTSVKKAKRLAPDTPKDVIVEASPSKMRKRDEKENSFQTEPMPPPTQPPLSSVKLRKKSVPRPNWKSLSMTRRLKEEEKRPMSLFRSPSIYADDNVIESTKKKEEEKESQIMTSYLSGKICPLTPSQQQTDISHLVRNELEEKLNKSNHNKNETTTRALVPAQLFPPPPPTRENSGMGSFCNVM